MLPRSYLFVPGDRPERFAKALASGADAVVLDLEDAVAEPAKPAARAALAAWLPTLGPTEHARVLVRINAEHSAHFADDLALLATTRPAAVVLPKAEEVAIFAHLQSVCPGIHALPLVESAAGMLAAHTLAGAPGVQRLVFGTLDYTLDLDLPPEPQALEAGHAHLALVSRATGIAAPVAGVTAAFDDEAALRADWAQARRHGFGAKLCIHPRQLAPLHAAMAPAEAEIAWARRVLAAAANSTAGAVQLDGRMIDRPVVERARRLIDRAAR
jgi:citrate lyase subunit beta / citryl-CoA lyase